MDLTGVNFTPIGTKEKPFRGIFQGESESNKAEITNLNINTEQDFVGLFGALGDDAEIRYISVSGTVTNTKENNEKNPAELLAPTPSAGLLVGTMTGSAIVDGCVTTAGSSVKAQRAGGIIGEIEGGTVINCVNNASVKNLEVYNDENKLVGGAVGGIAGTAGHYPEATIFPEIRIENCENRGAVTTTNNYTAGGIIGILQNEDESTRNKVGIYNSENYAEIKGKNSVGGIVGSIRNAIVDNATNEGSITIDDSAAVRNHIGGIAGIIEYTGSISNSTNKGEIYTKSSIVGGIAGRIANNSEITSSVNSGSVKGIRYVGGIIGEMVESTINGNSDNQTINSGNVTATGDSIGGIIGRAENSEIFYTKNESEVTGTTSVGGVVGTAYTGTSISNAENSGTIKATNIGDGSAGGIVGNTGKGNAGSVLSITNTKCTGNIEGNRAAGLVSNTVKEGSPITVSNVEINAQIKGRCLGGIASYIYSDISMSNVTVSNDASFTYDSTYTGTNIIGKYIAFPNPDCDISFIFDNCYIGDTLITENNIGDTSLNIGSKTFRDGISNGTFPVTYTTE